MTEKTKVSRARIMVVEDEWLIARDIQMFLKNMDYEVCSVVSSGEEALERVAEERPDIVLMDIVLKEKMSGVEAARQIHTLFRIPHIFITAYADDKMIESAKTTEPSGYLLKPFDEKELSAAIEMALYKHKIEMQLKESEERYRDVVEGTGDLITRVDGQGRFTYVNQMAQSILGVSPDQCIGMSAFEFIHPDDRQRTEEWFHNCSVHRLKQDLIENRQVNKMTGAFHTIEWVSNIYYGKDGRVERINGIGRNITEQKKLQEERERLNKELQQILNITSHDLRTPLVNVQGYGREISNLVDGIEKLITQQNMSADAKGALARSIQEIRTGLGYVKSSADKMEALISGLLKLARSGNVELKKVQIDMNRLLSDVISGFAHVAGETGVTIECSDLPSCFGDEHQINQVFSNLIGNALKYLDPGLPGMITITGQRTRVTSTYCVQDNGIGIAPENTRTIFEIFRQVEPSEKGEGLGLAIVCKILDRHNGRIWVDSAPGKGSRFYVSLPAK